MNPDGRRRRRRREAARMSVTVARRRRVPVSMRALVVALFVVGVAVVGGHTGRVTAQGSDARPFDRSAVDDEVLAECLSLGDLSVLTSTDAREPMVVGEGPYMDTILQTTAVVTVPDTSTSRPITEWPRQLDYLGVAQPDHSPAYYRGGPGPGPVLDGDFIAELFVPANITTPLPLIVTTPPAQSPWTFRSYRDISRRVASYGFIVIVSAEPNSRKGWRSEKKIGDRGIDLLRYIEYQNRMPDSLLYKKYNGKAGVWGISMGGGGAMYAGITPDSGFDAIYALAPTYHAHDKTTAEGGYGAWDMKDLGIPLLATGEENQRLVDTSIHDYFTGEEAAPRLSIIIRGASHYTWKNFTFSTVWMAVWFNLYLKRDISMVPLIWGPRSMRGTLTADRDNLSIQKRAQIGLAIGSEPRKEGSLDYFRAELTNRRDYQPARMCVVDLDDARVVDAVHVDSAGTRNVAVPVDSRNLAVINLEDLTTLYAIKGLNY